MNTIHQSLQRTWQRAQNLMGITLLPPEQDDPQQDHALLYELRLALQDMNDAQNYFNSVSDPELVDYALYEVEAARRKYEYLLRQARREGLRASQVGEP